MSTVCVPSGAQVPFAGTAAETRAYEQSPEGNAKRRPGLADSPSARALYRILLTCWSGLMKVLASQRPAKKNLRVCESVSLGDKRFVAVVQVGQERFLIGGATNSIAMLTRLGETEPSFSDTMKNCAQAGSGHQGPELSRSELR